MSESIRTARKDPAVQALVLQSHDPNVFCAGLDLRELLHRPDEDRARMVRFWKSYQQLYLDLYGCYRLATVAAIEGPAHGAGCMVAMSCDYRGMADNDDDGSAARIGLNESKLGIVAPPWLGQQFVDTVGRRQAELGMALGTMYSPREALDIGLVDRLVESSKVKDVARDVARAFVEVPASSRAAAKRMIRKNRIEKLATTRQEDVEDFLRAIADEKTQKGLGAYLSKLTAGNDKKKKKDDDA